MILIISFISSFVINKLNLFPALTAPFKLFFFQIYLLHLKLPGALFLGEEIAIFVSTFFPKLSNQEPKDPPD